MSGQGENITNMHEITYQYAMSDRLLVLRTIRRFMHPILRIVSEACNDT